MKKAYLPLVASVVLLAACGDDPVGVTADEPFMSVSMTGDIEQNFQGSGTFHTGTRPTGDVQFQIVSRGVGEFSNEGIAITRWTGGHPPTGTYEFDLAGIAQYRAGETQELPLGMTLQYGRRIAAEGFPSGQSDEFYVAHSGSLQITVSTPERVEGTFTASVFRYCARDADLTVPTHQVGPCELPSQVIPGAPTAQVSGSFVAVPLDNEVHILW